MMISRMSRAVLKRLLMYVSCMVPVIAMGDLSDGNRDVKNKTYDLSKHPFFKKWIDPKSGIASYVLTERIASLQWPFYFTNPSISPDGKYLWFYAANPPNPQLFLGCVSLDPEKPWIKSYPQAGFSSVSPMIAPDSKGIYFTCRNHVYYMDLEGRTKIIMSLPDEYIKNRLLHDIATHLSLSCDGKYLLLDGHVGNVTFVATGNMKTGEVKILHEFDNYHDHGQFSPIEPNLFLIPRDWRRDDNTGRYVYMEMRLWIMNIEQTLFRPLCPDIWEGHTADTAHEWWSKDGKVCFVDYGRGVFKCDPHTLKREHIWQRPICHAHCDSTSSYFCGDQSPYYWNKIPVKILFYDRKEKTEKEIVSAMPPPSVSRSDYHVDPHPHFSPDDQNIIYMTTVMNQIDVAITPIDQLKKEK
ncbi:MAG TPA: hypothetical protein DE060_19270 [Lentisphaeria bacterium]|nr:hypothetical protein [Lentisphaeria bacterium]HCG51330.1 hypothetical protein [Lentisphaeria bacterium]